MRLCLNNNGGHLKDIIFMINLQKCEVSFGRHCKPGNYTLISRIASLRILYFLYSAGKNSNRPLRNILKTYFREL